MADGELMGTLFWVQALFPISLWAPSHEDVCKALYTREWWLLHVEGENQAWEVMEPPDPVTGPLLRDHLRQSLPLATVGVSPRRSLFGSPPLTFR